MSGSNMGDVVHFIVVVGRCKLICQLAIRASDEYSPIVPSEYWSMTSEYETI